MTIVIDISSDSFKPLKKIILKNFLNLIYLIYSTFYITIVIIVKLLLKGPSCKLISTTYNFLETSSAFITTIFD